MSTTVLKVIAIISMLIDHLGASGIVPFDSPWNTVCRVIGRLAFPLFCFCVAEGIKHSRNRKKYILRLFIFALISEIPFDLMVYKTWYTWESQNVIFTLLLAVVGVTIFEEPEILGKLTQKYEKNPDTYAYKNADWVVKSFILAICAILGYLLKTDYGWFGVCLIYIIYFTSRLSKPKRYTIIAATLIGYGLLQMIAGSGVLMALYWLAASASLIFIMMYNNQKGKGLKWLFYVFYPTHMLVLAALYFALNPDMIVKLGMSIGIS